MTPRQRAEKIARKWGLDGLSQWQQIVTDIEQAIRSASMGWGTGTNKRGESVGYMVKGACEHPDCGSAINKGVSYVCGGEHDGGKWGCGHYFCERHLDAAMNPADRATPGGEQLCPACKVRVEKIVNTRPAPSIDPPARRTP